jgi:hypothetical protein
VFHPTVEAVSRRGGAGSIPRQVLGDLWWGRFPMDASVSLANSHSTDCPILMTIYHPGPVNRWNSGRRTKWTQSYPTQRDEKKGVCKDMQSPETDASDVNSELRSFEGYGWLAWLPLNACSVIDVKPGRIRHTSAISLEHSNRNLRLWRTRAYVRKWEVFFFLPRRNTVWPHMREYSRALSLSWNFFTTFSRTLSRDVYLDSSRWSRRDIQNVYFIPETER